MKKITDKVFVLESARGAYAYLIRGGEMMLVDTGFSWVGKRLLKELKSANIEAGEIKHILLTHYDLDHVGNAAMLQRITGLVYGLQRRTGRIFSGKRRGRGSKNILLQL